jgi:hypothetical protein
LAAFLGPDLLAFAELILLLMRDFAALLELSWQLVGSAYHRMVGLRLTFVIPEPDHAGRNDHGDNRHSSYCWESVKPARHQWNICTLVGW